MVDAIGETAGKVWQALQNKKEVTPTQLKKALGVDDKALWLALGWLAREDKVTIKKDKNTFKIDLK